MGNVIPGCLKKRKTFSVTRNNPPEQENTETEKVAEQTPTSESQTKKPQEDGSPPSESPQKGNREKEISTQNKKTTEKKAKPEPATSLSRQTPWSRETSKQQLLDPRGGTGEETRTSGTLGIVGIFSRSSNTDYSWIEQQLKSPDLGPMVSEVRPCYISNNPGKFYEEVGRCSFGILYHTKNRGKAHVTDVTDSLYDEELEAMSQILNRENVIVVIDDLKDIEEKRRILRTQPSIKKYAFDLLLFSEREKKDGEHVENLREAIISLTAGKKTSGITEETRTPGKLGVVGIFSRSSNTDYSWMETVLKSPDLAPVVSEVRPFYISSYQSKRFFEDLGRCSFGILYHTKNRGGVNVTDVTDSLYDEELEAMSQILRRENVIVVIDDLRDSDIREKRRILATQPSIDRYAFDLLLFSEQEKKDGDHEERLTEAIMSLAAGRKTAG